jgi:predicted GH43/DUF377 family glycosyl hydrolase
MKNLLQSLAIVVHSLQSHARALYGKVPNVVFSCGNVVFDGKVLVYYGGADSVLCVADFELNELIPKN